MPQVLNPPARVLRLASTLNDLDDEELDEIVQLYGEPKRLHYRTDFLEFECHLVRRSRDKGRNHDVTCFIRQDEDSYVVIQKHQYARSGIYRAPSGGAKFGEGLLEAAVREMREETGLDVELKRFILDLDLDVVCPEEVIPWRSLVFLAEPVGGEMKQIDTYEIFDVKSLTKDELLGDIDVLMRESGWGGFSYRSFLTREFFRTLDELDI